MKKIDAAVMKKVNLNNVRQVLKQVETATKPQLASTTNLSVVTVNSLLKELLELGEVVEDQIVPSNGGRPALTYRYNYNFSLALVVYFKEEQGRGLLSISVVNLNDQILHHVRFFMQSFDIPYFFQVLEKILDLYPAIKMIGIGIPGQMVNGEIIVSSHKELIGFRMAEELEARFELPVIVENDINAAICGYCAQQLAVTQAEELCVAGIYFPTKFPPGMGIWLDGKIVKGKNGMAGEIKFLPLDIDWYEEIDQSSFLTAVIYIIQSVTAVLAPHRIVLYQHMIPKHAWHSAWKAFQDNHKMPAFPDVICQQTFNQDFEMGMRWLTLKELEHVLIT